MRLQEPAPHIGGRIVLFEDQEHDTRITNSCQSPPPDLSIKQPDPSSPEPATDRRKGLPLDVVPKFIRWLGPHALVVLDPSSLLMEPQKFMGMSRLARVPLLHTHRVNADEHRKPVEDPLHILLGRRNHMEAGVPAGLGTHNRVDLDAVPPQASRPDLCVT